MDFNFYFGYARQPKEVDSESMPFEACGKKSVFITLEGGDGAGKSTLAKTISETLSHNGVDTVITREPGGSPLAEHIRALVLDPEHEHQWSPMSEALLMNAARREHLRTTIIPALSEGKWVICDRFMDSTRAYQARVSTDLLDMLEQQVVTHRPDITFLLDAAPEDLLGRRKLTHAQKDRFERRSLPYHRHVRARFLEIAEREPKRVVILNALDRPETILEKAVSHLEAFLTKVK